MKSTTLFSVRSAQLSNGTFIYCIFIKLRQHNADATGVFAPKINLVHFWDDSLSVYAVRYAVIKFL